MLGYGPGEIRELEGTGAVSATADRRGGMTASGG